MSDQAESSRRSTPMTPPRPPSPTIPEGSSSEAILWAASEDDSSSTAHTDLISHWLSNNTGLPQLEAQEEPVTDVPTLLNFELDSSFLDLVDWNTTNTAFTQAPVVTQPVWVQLHSPAASEMDDLSRLAGEIRYPTASILPLAGSIQDPEACVSTLALGIQPQPASSEIVAPQASLSPWALALQFPEETPQAPISPLIIGTESSIIPMASGIEFPEASISPPMSPLALGIQSVPSSLSSLPPIPCTLPMAPPLWNLIPTIPCTQLPVAPPLWNLPSIPGIPPLWNLPSIPGTIPMAPPLWNFLPSSFPVPERRSWSEFPSTPPPPARGQFLLPDPDSASGSASSPFDSHQPHHFFPAANTGHQQQQVSVAHAPVTFSTGNANANAAAIFSTGFVPAVSRPSWSQAMAPRESWTPNQPWISSGQVDLKAPTTPRRPRFLLPTPATMPAPLSLPIANSGSSMGNMPSGSARRDVPVGDQQRVQTPGESSRPRKRAKPTVAPIARDEFAFEPALNRNGKARALPGTATDLQSLFSRHKREKVKQRIKILQRVVPNGDQVDLAILLEQTHIHIKSLEQEIKVLKSSVDWKLANLPHSQ